MYNDEDIKKKYIGIKNTNYLYNIHLIILYFNRINYNNNFVQLDFRFLYHSQQ